MDEGVEICTKIVKEVAQVKDVDPLDLAPLLDVVDPDALNNLVTNSTKGVEVIFMYEGYRVSVQGDGQVQLDKEKSRSK